MDNIPKKKLSVELHLEALDPNEKTEQETTEKKPEIKTINNIHNYSHNLFSQPDKKDSRVRWAFRVLFNNLLFLGLTTTAGIISSNHIYGNHKHGVEVVTQPAFSNPNIKLINDGAYPNSVFLNLKDLKFKGIQKSVVDNNMKDIERYKNTSGSLYMGNFENNLSPVQLAIIYNKPEIIKQFVKKQPNIIEQSSLFSPTLTVNDKNYSLLLLPEAINSGGDFGFEAKTALIDAGYNISSNNYEIVKKTIGTERWLNYWVEYFKTAKKSSILEEILKQESGNTNNILNDIEAINKIQHLKTT